jgi:hypothetical protein
MIRVDSRSFKAAKKASINLSDARGAKYLFLRERGGESDVPPRHATGSMFVNSPFSEADLCALPTFHTVATVGNTSVDAVLPPLNGRFVPFETA